MLALYNIIATLCWPLLWFYPPFRGTLRRRLGHFSLGDYNPAGRVAAADAASGKTGRTHGLKFLVNAVSAGEVVAISSLLSELKRRAPGSQTVLLTTTKSGQEMARSKAAGLFDLLAYFPLIDLPFVVRRYLRRLRPDVYITTESELWPNMQAQCRARGIPVVLVNARIYLHNKQGLRGRVVRALYEQVDLIVCQDELQRERFLKFGLPPARLAVSGNIKFDFDIPQWDERRAQAWQAQWGRPDWLTVVAGSTHEGEDELLLDALIAARRDVPGGRVRLILAPRHVDRVSAVAELVRARGYSAVTMAQAEGRQTQEWDVLVIDRYGVLIDVYRLADLVVMGGTFHPKVGGHNVLEATALGKPVVVGPHTFSIVSQLELLRGDDAVFECAADIHSAGAAAELGALLAGLLADPARRTASGERARALTVANRGAAKRAVELVLEHLQRK